MKDFKELTNVVFREDDDIISSVLTFDDSSTIYIFVQSGMIFVADCDYAELTQLINDDKLDSFEAYDTTDCCDYYSKSKYAEHINNTLLYIANRFL